MKARSTTLIQQHDTARTSASSLTATATTTHGSKEATKDRGLLNLRTTPDALPYLTAAKNVEMLTRHKVYSGSELKSRCEINLDNYRKTVHIEAKTMLDMARREILPAVTAYADTLALGVNARRAAVGASVGGYEARQIEKLSALSEKIDAAAEELETALDAYHAMSEVQSSAEFIRDSVLPEDDGAARPLRRSRKAHPREELAVPDLCRADVRREIKSKKQKRRAPGSFRRAA